MASNIPRPTFGPNGFVAPAEGDVLTGAMADLNVAFGGALNPGLSTPQGQLASTIAAVVGDKNVQFIWFSQMVDPAFSEGRMQDAIGRIYYLARHPATPTTVVATLVGAEGTVIPAGSLARADDGRLYESTGDATIPASGTIDVTFQCQETGPIPLPAGALNQIYQAIFGWDTITNAAAGTPGSDVEGRGDFEERRFASVGINSAGTLGAIYGAVAAVDNVSDVFVYENTYGYARWYRGVYLAANSIYVAVLGGTDDDVAQAVWSRKPPGVGYTGNTTVEVLDPNPAYEPPAPTYEVKFQRPAPVPFFVVVTLKNARDVPPNAADLVRTAVVNNFTGADGSVRVRIGATVYASRFECPVQDIAPWARRVISIRLATEDAAEFTASISGVTMTVTAVTSGVIAAGQVLRDDLGNVVQGVEIVDYGTGTGGTGTYLLSQGQTVASQTIRSVEPLEVVEMDVDEAPTLDAGDVAVVFE